LVRAGSGRARPRTKAAAGPCKPGQTAEVKAIRSPVYKTLTRSLEDKVLALVRQQGYTPLYKLGQALGCTPAQLGEAVNSLRRQGKLSGSAAEGRGASDEERRWWVPDVSGSGKLGAVTPRG
jgi:hypothetical protein